MTLTMNLLEGCPAGQAKLTENRQVSLLWEGGGELLLTPRELAQFSRMITYNRRKAAYSRAADRPDERELELALNANAKLVVSYNELIRLQKILTSANLMVEVYGALDSH